jgi:hypothetical protein
MARNSLQVLIVAVVIGLLIGAAAGYYARVGEVTKLQNDLSHAIESNNMLKEELGNLTVPIVFVPESGQMIHDTWLLVAPIGQGKFGVTIHAEGLEDTKGDGIYLVEGVMKGQPTRMVPLGQTLDSSEFHADSKGVGNLWVATNQDPRSTFDKVLLLFLPGMSMERAVLLATAKLG